MLKIEINTVVSFKISFEIASIKNIIFFKFFPHLIKYNFLINLMR